MASIILVNKLSQTLSVALRNDAGIVEEVKLAGAARTEPFNEKQLTEQTRNLIRAGHLQVRPVA